MANVSGVTRHFTTAQEGFTTTLASSVASGATTVPLNSLAGYTDGDEVALVIEPGATAEQVVIGTKSGTSLVNAVWTEGTNQAHAAGATAADYVSATQQSAQTKGTLVGHNQDGTHKAFSEANIVPTNAIQNSAVTNAKIATSTISPDKRDSTLLGTLQTRTSNATSGSTTTPVSWNGFSGSYTFSAVSGTTYRIHLHEPTLFSASSQTNQAIFFRFLIDGTRVGGVRLTMSTTGIGWMADGTAYYTASSTGTKTLTVQFLGESTTPGTWNANASTDDPAFLSVSVV